MYRRVSLPLALLLITCATARSQEIARQLLDPSKALVGHWVTDSGNTHYYFSGDKQLIMVDYGQTKKLIYEVLSEDKAEEVLRLRCRTATGSHEKTLRFATDRKGLLQTVTFVLKDKKSYVNAIWKYVDAKTEPEK
jgi:hypothetical protein